LYLPNAALHTHPVEDTANGDCIKISKSEISHLQHL